MINTVREAKVAVRILKRFLKNQPIPVSLSHAEGLQLLAEMTGHKTWEALSAALANTRPIESVSDVAYWEDEVPCGATGRLVTKSGVSVIGTYEKVFGTAGIISGIRQPNGTFEVQYAGGTDIDWDSQVSVTRAGSNEVLFVTEEGDIVGANEVKVVASDTLDDNE